MTVLLDKNVDTNIESIFYTNDGVEYDQYFWNLNENTSISVDNITFRIGVTASNVYFKFKTLESMNVYLDQYKRAHKPRDIFTNGFEPDPYYDLPQTGTIVSHTYTNTDIEKTLIQGS